MTTDSNPRARMVRFATFEADLSAGELRKGGVKIKVHGQPFEVLAMLLEQPGEIVPREELKQKLWPTDTFVDFDHGVNTAIKRLREALGDSAENPRFVETIPRRGYRFIAPIEPLAASPAVKPDAIEASPLARVNPDLPPELEHIITKALEKDRKLRYQHATHSQTDLERLKRDSETARMVASKGEVSGAKGKYWKAILLSSVLILTLAGASYFYLHRVPKLTDKDTIVLADFTNTTGDTVFDGTLRQAMA